MSSTVSRGVTVNLKTPGLYIINNHIPTVENLKYYSLSDPTSSSEYEPAPYFLFSHINQKHKNDRSLYVNTC